MMVLKWVQRGIIITDGLEIAHDLYLNSRELVYGPDSLVHDALLGPF